MRQLTWLATVLGLLIARPGSAQLLDEGNQLTVPLRDGTIVVVMGEAPSFGSTAKTNRFHYLPTNLHVSPRRDGVPEFLFLKYTTEARASAGGIQGGLLHFLMEWGLTSDQQKELQERLTAQSPGAQLVGPATVSAAGDNGSFRIISATLSSQARTRSLVMSGKAPVVSGSKVAVAADLDQYGAQLLDASFEKTRSISDVSLELQLTYRTLVPAAKGRVTISWDRLARSYDSLVADYGRQYSSEAKTQDCFLFFCASSSRPQYSYSYDEMRRQYDFLMERKVIEFHWDEYVDDERVSKIREAFVQFFLEQFAKRADPSAPPAPSDTAGTPDIRTGDRYTFRRITRQEVEQHKVDEFGLDLRLAFNRPFTVTGNLASWYNAVRDNPACVATINLNDPFFQHFDVAFHVDFDAPRELFSSAINYVTVTLRKERSSGHPFEESVTFDENYVKDHGVLATLTYARGEDKTPGEYLYKAQWSLKGGKLFPASPTWQRGSTASVVLTPPIIARKIELEGDLAALKASDITRVTAQVHYLQFGQELEDNIQLPVVSGEPLVSKALFMDRDARGYVYRLIINHKTEGKLALPWSPKLGDDYIYAAIPPQLLSDASLKDAAKAAASDVAQSATQKVLQQFQQVLGGNNQ